MPSRKVLGSVIHNLAHSFMSSLGYVDGDYIAEHLRRAVEASGVSRVVIDALDGSIEPPALGTEALRKATKALPKELKNLVIRSGASMDMVRTAEILIEFDLNSEPERDVTPSGILIRRNYTCEGRIVDDQGGLHSGTVPVWWRY